MEATDTDFDWMKDKVSLALVFQCNNERLEQDGVTPDVSAGAISDDGCRSGVGGQNLHLYCQVRLL
jgi:hypothetical protein